MSWDLTDDHMLLTCYKRAIIKQTHIGLHDNYPSSQLTKRIFYKKFRVGICNPWILGSILKIFIKFEVVLLNLAINKCKDFELANTR